MPSDIKCMGFSIQDIQAQIDDVKNLLKISHLSPADIELKASNGNYVCRLISQSSKILEMNELSKSLPFSSNIFLGQHVERHNPVEVLPLLAFLQFYKKAVGLNNFEPSIPLSLIIDDKESEKYEFIMRTAVSYTNIGHTVDFLPVSYINGQKTPDIAVLFKGQTVQVECKKKDIPKPLIRDHSNIQDLIKMIQNHINEFRWITEGHRIDITIYSIGECNIENTSELCGIILGILEQGKFGTHKFNKRIFIDVNKKSIELQPNKAGLLVIPPYTENADVIALLEMSNDGSSRIFGAVSVEFAILDANSLTSIMNSFRHARQQISKEHFGVIHIELNTALLPNRHLINYLNFVYGMIMNQFTPQCNTRIKAVILSTEPVVKFIPSHRFENLSAVVENKYCVGLKDFFYPSKYSFVTKILQDESMLQNYFSY